MRIISGEKKGLPLKSVPGNTTRPTADKVKESIFNMIGPYFQGGIMLDLYAGSGAIGIEAISRGMDKVVFVDREKKAVETIYTNLNKAKLIDKAEVFRTDSNRALKAIKKKERSFDFIFLDPPYAKENLILELLFIGEHDILKNGGYIVAEHSSKVSIEDEQIVFKVIRQETYGDTTVTIFSNAEEEDYE
ncbi:16S rRNA (guanine(966)-N(2))-methyltransferase RsmD [Salipaludibacillus daqingensis]|uniref:16S rRNA (guanine(966)-N(2))-methyltransferase RsmD n=1 Tax=Salipaludibacillus daqingensis TaxID=3041001 RepID=UPI0024745C2B|nr:16S rRNA (guanine(966)-N(2))-methyltransferase RsmD [Salipaludibacillus daqingensis]